MKDAKAITMKNARPATQGVCPTCGTRAFRIRKELERIFRVSLLLNRLVV